MRFPGWRACSTRPRTEPLLQTVATVGPFAILGEGVSQVELGGLGPPAPCLQDRPGYRMWSLTWGCCHGASAGIGLCRILLWSDLVVSVRRMS
jgi:hypothetical protein